MTSEIRAEMRRMTPEARAEARLVEKRVREEVLATKYALSAKLNAMTDGEQLAYFKQLGEKYRALGFNVV